MRLSKPKAFFLSLIFPIAYLLIQLGVSSVAAGWAGFAAVLTSGGDPAAAMQTTTEWVSKNVLIIAGVSSAITIAAVYIWLIGAKKNIAAELNLKRIDPLSLVLALVLGVAANLAVSGLLSLLPIPEGMMNQYSETVGDMLTSGTPLASIICVGILGPVAEEYAFRGMCMGTLRRGFKALTALIVAAVVFALAHIVPLQMAYVLPVAFLLGFVFLWTDSLYGTIAMHIAFNLTSTLAGLLFGEEELAAEAAGFSWETLLVTLAGLLVGAACMYGIWRRRRASASDLPPGPAPTPEYYGE